MEGNFLLFSISFNWLSQILNSELLSETILVVHTFSETFQTIHVSEIIAIVITGRKTLFNEEEKRHLIFTAALPAWYSIKRIVTSKSCTKYLRCIPLYQQYTYLKEYSCFEMTSEILSSALHHLQKSDQAFFHVVASQY